MIIRGLYLLVKPYLGWIKRSDSQEVVGLRQGAAEEHPQLEEEAAVGDCQHFRTGTVVPRQAEVQQHHNQERRRSSYRAGPRRSQSIHSCHSRRRELRELQGPQPKEQHCSHQQRVRCKTTHLKQPMAEGHWSLHRDLRGRRCEPMGQQLQLGHVPKASFDAPLLHRRRYSCPSHHCCSR